jgi:glyoxylase-like metal-dependent hydrolase (beta-lactamase superfamily II)
MGGKLVDGEPGLFRFANMVCHVLLIESDHGLVLVDTGYGRSDLARLPGSLHRAMTLFLRPVPDPAIAAISQIEALGHKASDVRHIILTHLDLDHAGGLRDFPDATVHVYAPEHRTAMAQATTHDRLRFRAAQWAHGPKWETYDLAGGDDWFGFDAVRGLVGLPEDVLLVPLSGHTLGHIGVAVNGDDGWLLHAGDAYFHRSEVRTSEPAIPPMVATFEKLAQTDGDARIANQARLRELVRDHGDEVAVFSAHDPVELRRLAATHV